MGDREREREKIEAGQRERRGSGDGEKEKYLSLRRFMDGEREMGVSGVWEGWL